VKEKEPAVDLDVLLLGDSLLDEERGDVLPLVALSMRRQRPKLTGYSVQLQATVSSSSANAAIAI
jgi:hypothetical protein